MTQILCTEILSSAQRRRRALLGGGKMKGAGVVARTPVDVNERVISMSGEGSNEKEKKRGRKRKLFDSRSNFMSDIPGLESVSEEMRNVEGTQQKRKTMRRGNGINRTMDMLKQEGSLTDLCNL